MTFLIALATASCAATGQVEINNPQSGSNNYPQVIEESSERRESAEASLKKFLSEWSLPETEIERFPVTLTPRSLPPEWAGKINLKIKPAAFGEIEAKEAARQFIEHSIDLLGGNTVGLKDLSLVSFANEGNMFRVTFWQANYSFQIAEGFGELHLLIGKNGDLLQWSSNLIPLVKLPARAEIESKTIYDKLLNREFQYSNIAGRPQIYKTGNRQDIHIGELIVYPKLDGNLLKIHLAFPVIVGSGMTWTVYIDAITGEELGLKQNFAT